MCYNSDLGRSVTPLLGENLRHCMHSDAASFDPPWKGRLVGSSMTLRVMLLGDQQAQT